MRKLLWLLLVLLPLGLVPGCGGDREKGIYKDKEKPRPPESKS